MSNNDKHWSKVEYLHQTVTNPNIHISGEHSYYSEYWDDGFEKAWSATCTATASVSNGRRSAPLTSCGLAITFVSLPGSSS
ncbi:hypothetical protein SODG_003419 [Sodalis praecaptivus]